MKIMEILDNRCHHEYTEFSSMEEARLAYPEGTIDLVEAPDNVWEGYGYDPSQEGDARFIRPPLNEGWDYDDQGHPYDVLETRAFERRMYHESTTNDTMEALRKIREGDQSHDWNAWLDLLDQYNADVSATVNQSSYPNKVVYPDYPTRPWENQR